MTMHRLVRRCVRCDRWIGQGEPYELGDFGWQHTVDCGWGAK